MPPDSPVSVSFTGVLSSVLEKKHSTAIAVRILKKANILRLSLAAFLRERRFLIPSPRYYIRDDSVYAEKTEYILIKQKDLPA